MKFEFNKLEKKDNRVAFRDLKPGDVFTISDPNAAKSTVFMKVKMPKGSTATYDTINMDTAELGYYGDMMKEIIAIDQAYVYKHSATLNIVLD
jgi:hypothetical protein